MSSGDQFALIDKPYIKFWREGLEREIERRMIEKLQVLDEHDLMCGYPPETAKPVKVAKVKHKKGKKKAVRK